MRRRLFPLVATLLAWGLVAQAAEVDPKEVGPLNQSTERFLEALFRSDAKALAELGTDPFWFDGRPVAGRELIHESWTETLTRIDQELKNRKDATVELLDFRAVTKKFGAPPRKFLPLKLARCRFAQVSFKDRPGFLLILAPAAKKTWQVAGITD